MKENKQYRTHGDSHGAIRGFLNFLQDDPTTD